MQRFPAVTVMTLLLATCGRDSLAQDPTQSDSRFPIDQLKNDLSELATIVDHLGKCETEQAALLIANRNPFGDATRLSDEQAIERRQAIQRELRVFEQGPLRFDSVEYVGLRPISSQAGIVLLVGNGTNGPVLFRFQLFRHNGDWRLAGFDFHSHFQRINELIEPYQFENPYTIPTSSTTAEHPLAERPGDTESK